MKKYALFTLLLVALLVTFPVVASGLEPFNPDTLGSFQETKIMQEEVSTVMTFPVILVAEIPDAQSSCSIDMILSGIVAPWDNSAPMSAVGVLLVNLESAFDRDLFSKQIKRFEHPCFIGIA